MAQSKRHIGKEILAGLDEIAAWERGEQRLKTTRRRGSIGTVSTRSEMIGRARRDPAFREALP
jgi:hypothetical protein